VCLKTGFQANIQLPEPASMQPCGSACINPVPSAGVLCRMGIWGGRDSFSHEKHLVPCVRFAKFGSTAASCFSQSKHLVCRPCHFRWGGSDASHEKHFEGPAKCKCGWKCSLYMYTIPFDMYIVHSKATTAKLTIQIEIIIDVIVGI
jgi:hypothetical protein